MIMYPPSAQNIGHTFLFCLDNEACGEGTWVNRGKANLTSHQPSDEHESDAGEHLGTGAKFSDEEALR